jgi:predicted transcriptional regulator
MARRPLAAGRKGRAPLVHARLVADDFDRVTELAEARGLTRSEVLRDAVAEYLARAASEGAVAS